MRWLGALSRLYSREEMIFVNQELFLKHVFPPLPLPSIWRYSGCIYHPLDRNIGRERGEENLSKSSLHGAIRIDVFH